MKYVAPKRDRGFFSEESSSAEESCTDEAKIKETENVSETVDAQEATENKVNLFKHSCLVVFCTACVY